VHDVRAARIDQRVSESALAVRNREAPVAAPVDGRDDDVTRRSCPAHRSADTRPERRCRKPEQVDARRILAGGPFERNAARLEAERIDANAALLRDINVARRGGAVGVLAGACNAETG